VVVTSSDFRSSPDRDCKRSRMAACTFSLVLILLPQAASSTMTPTAAVCLRSTTPIISGHSAVPSLLAGALYNRDIPMQAIEERQSLAALLRSDHRYKYLDALITLFVVVLLISNIVAAKFFAIGLLRVSAAQILFPITYIFADVFTEVYGYGASRRAIWYGFFASFILVSISFIAVEIPPAPEYKDQAAFATIFKPVGRIVVASLLAYWCGEFANSFTLAKLKLVTKGRYLWTRTIGSTVVGQAVDTTVVMFAAFYGTRPLSVIVRLIVAGYVIKVIYETLMTPVTYAVVNFLKRTEKVDYFDYDTNFNPFATTEPV
jgi:queuosine precursor transporter